MKTLILILILLFSSKIFANCQISHSPSVQNDALFVTLQSLASCPQNVFELKEALANHGLGIKPAMVANRGRNNPQFGSFSFFETAEGILQESGQTVAVGELFFGHFTTLHQGVVDLDQQSARHKLLVELIAWDYQKQVFNFYELVGTATSPQWFYRGDSKDAYLDNEFLKRQPDPENPQFGRRMRCSACHTSGGPIMKEMAAPFNDWWTSERPLTFGSNPVSTDLELWLSELIPASEFSSAVKIGIDKLAKSEPFQKFKGQLSLQEQMRPLFCTQEINLISSETPSESSASQFQVHSSFWVNSILASTSVVLSKDHYKQALVDLNFNFPETNQMDADHPWLSPVKGHSDMQAITQLVDDAIIDWEWVSDVLAVDFENPLFSDIRCDLLKLLPESKGPHWKEDFIAKLQVSVLPGAAILLKNFNDPSQSETFHKNQAQAYIKAVQKQLSTQQGVGQQLLDLQSKRAQVFQDEISQNPMGQILEPGFRVIFPRTL